MLSLGVHIVLVFVEALPSPKANDTALKVECVVFDFDFQSAQTAVGIDDGRYKDDGRSCLRLIAANMNGDLIANLCPFKCCRV